MADETVINGEFSDARTVDIAGDEASSKISGLTAKITDLEHENAKTILENEGYKQQIDELKASVKALTAETAELRKQVDEAESENKVLGSVAARAAELEADVSRLQHDLISTTSDLQETTVEVSNLKRDLEGAKEKDVKLEAIGNERDLLLAKVEKLEELQSSLRGEYEAKEKEIRGLKKRIEELEVAVESSKGFEKLKNKLEKEIEKFKVEISSLQSGLKEKENVINEFEIKERENGDALIVGEKELAIGGLKQKDWVVVGGSAVAAVAVLGAVCYVHARKN
ncbi:hypothetical protein PHJA_000930900 [Phtheirospermum japonicum]|uniref:Uncharacterized protein n=1 Tax=Phtheirospermum japonicum TaxID=374723 RepID=A0A830BP66_9LAMI|nr:hypothetical protein PHJA_000930900 [Phtheirospermum japonicum]